MSTNYRKQIVVVLTFLSGLYFFLEFLTPEAWLVGAFGKDFSIYHQKISEGFILVGAMAIFLGVINLLRFHSESILKSRKGWVNSAILIISLLLTLGIRSSEVVLQEQRVDELTKVGNWSKFVERIKDDFYDKKNVGADVRVSALLTELDTFKDVIKDKESIFHSEDPTKISEALSKAKTESRILRLAYERHDNRQINTFSEQLSKTLEEVRQLSFSASQANLEDSGVKQASSLIFEAFFVPLGSAMFSLLAFYVASAAYRSFRVKTLEAGIMMLTALLVVLGQIPQGPLYVYSGLPAIREWILEYLSTPAFRAILFGSMIAGLSMAFRMWLSLDDSPLDGEAEDGGTE